MTKNQIIQEAVLYADTKISRTHRELHYQYQIEYLAERVEEFMAGVLELKKAAIKSGLIES